MRTDLRKIDVRLSLTEEGDALLYGLDESGGFVPGMRLKQLLFAWHEASYYGTELEIRSLRNIEIVELPAEFVVPFFAELPLLGHVDWAWGGEAELLRRLAPALMACAAEKRYAPSREAMIAGRLHWKWEDREIDRRIDALVESGEADDDFGRRLRAAFTAAVSGLLYGTEERAADLRREFPLLFDAGAGEAARSMSDDDWLVHIGWRQDTAPFRPALQLVEPEPNEAEWRLRFVLQDKERPGAIAPVRLGPDGSVSGEWPEAWTEHLRQRAAGWHARLRAALPGLAPAEAWPREGVMLDDAAAWRFLTADSGRLIAAGWQVLLPGWWEETRRAKPRLRARVRADAGGGPALFGLHSLVDFDWRVAVGNAELSEREFLELAERGQRLVRIRGRWVALDPAMLSRIRKAMAKYDPSRGLSFRDVLQLHLLGGTSGEPAPDAAGGDDDGDDGDGDARIALEVELSGRLLRMIGQLSRPEEHPLLPAPAGLQTALRPYQQAGFSWLVSLRRFGLGACLADDMGLGKTVQLIAYLLHARDEMRNEGRPMPSLIVCPTSVIGNWLKELARFAPSLRVLLHYGGGRSSGAAFREAAESADVVLTTYTTAALDRKTLAGVPWDAVCLDEAQNIKNHATKQASAVRTLPARHRIALTGTPIENRLAELWSIFDFLNPGYLGSQRAFGERYGNAALKDGGDARLAELRKLVKPFLLRRQKQDPAVQLDLPEKNEMKTYVHLTAEQAAWYERTVRELLEKSGELAGIERKGAILAAITRLKQLCSHPALVTKEPLPALGQAPDEGVPTGGADGPAVDAAALAARSAKLERLMEMVKELREAGERCLIFTQYVGMGRLIQAVLQETLGEPVLYLHGGTPRAMRERMIEMFQSGGDLPAGGRPHVFILSLKAGGVGLNLTAATHVFHYDRWWNPAVENQATDRAYRIGQKRNVHVYKFIALGTLEERIDEMLESKRLLSETVMAGSENWITELSTEELRELIALRRDLAR
jgi:SNF2 family DNA or RNA helicase